MYLKIDVFNVINIVFAKQHYQIIYYLQNISKYQLLIQMFLFNIYIIFSSTYYCANLRRGGSFNITQAKKNTKYTKLLQSCRIFKLYILSSFQGEIDGNTSNQATMTPFGDHKIYQQYFTSA